MTSDIEQRLRDGVRDITNDIELAIRLSHSDDLDKMRLVLRGAADAGHELYAQTDSQ